MTSRIIFAIAAALVAYIICVVLGTLLVTVNIGFAVVLGALLKGFATVIALVVGAFYFVRHAV